jgi:hypothetical protein
MIRRMRYLRVIWSHDFEDEPTVLWSEIGDDGFETRKVDEYRDGRFDYADETRSTGTTLLGDQRTPTLDEINADEEFTAAPISPSDSERVWQRATGR